MTDLPVPAQPWRIVAAREIKARITDRNFLVSTVVTLGLLIGVIVLQGFLLGQQTTGTLAVHDADGRAVAEATATRVAATTDDARLVVVTVADQAAGERALRDGSVDGLLSHGADGWRLTTLREPVDRLTTELATTISQATLAANAAAAGTSMEALTRGSQLATVSLETVDTSTLGLRRLLGFAFAMLFYIAAMLFGTQIATSVVEEKQSRIVEILTTAIPVRQLLLGKVVGNTVLAFAQMALYAAVGLVGIRVAGQTLELGDVLGAIGWFLAFFLAGFLALACMWAVAGSLASRNEDLQSTTTPLTMVLVAAFVVAFSVEGTARVVASYVPILSAMTMPSRIVAGEAQWWEPIVSLALTLVFAAGTILVGERLYRRTLLQTRGRVSLRAAWRLSD